MSGGSDLGRWALDDDQLEALLLGTSPAEAGLSGNPVAEFFADASHSRGVTHPRPDASLQQLFSWGDTSGVPSGDPGGAVQPETGQPGEQAFEGGVLPGGDGAFLDEDGIMIESGSWSQAAEVTAVVGPEPDAGDWGDDPPFSGSFDPRAGQSVLAHQVDRVYRPSPIRAAFAALRPTGPKLLMAGALVALLAATAHGLGLYDVPFLPTDSVENQAIGDGVDPPASDATAAPSDQADGATGQRGSTRLTTQDTRFVVTTVSVSPRTRPPATAATTTTEGTSSSSEDTSSTVESTTTIDGSSTTIDPASSTSDTTDGSSTTETSSSTTASTVGPTTTTIISTIIVDVVIGRLRVPDQIPAGHYQARVPPNEGDDDCTVTINGAGEITRSPGEIIAFDLADGDVLRNRANCPTSYAVS